MIVYALIDPRDARVRYVGKTHRTARRRLRRHLAPCFLAGNTHKERWTRSLLKMGLEPQIAVLEHCATPQALAAAERLHIARLIEAGVDLTNATPGGDGGSGPHTAESKEKIRRALTGKPKSAEHRERCAASNRGRRASEATRAKLRAVRGLPRRPLDETHRVNLSRAKGGLPFIDQHGNRYETQKGTARALGLNIAHLNDVLHGRRRHTRGFVFRFVAEEQDLRIREFPR